MKTERIKEYIVIESAIEDITEIFRKANEDYGFVLDDCDLQQEAVETAFRINDEMNEYLHSEDHHIIGNFCNIDYDWKGNDLKQRIALLDAGSTSDKAESFREFLTSWFWEAFGTFGLDYNFRNWLECIIDEAKYGDVDNTAEEMSDADYYGNNFNG